MALWQACLWGLLGAGLIEVRALWAAFHLSRDPAWPWRDIDGRPQWKGYAIAVACRLGMAAGLDAVYAAAHQIAGPLGAVTMGIAAPLVIQQMAAREHAPSAEPLTTMSEGARRNLSVSAENSDMRDAQSVQGDTTGG